MALYAVSAGGTILAADVNQYENLLNGTMTDQPVTFGNNLTATHGVKLGTSDPSAGPDIHSDGTNIYIETNGAGTIYIRPNGLGSNTNSATLDSTGKLTVAGSLAIGNSLTVPGATSMATLACTTINTAGNTINCGGLTATTGTYSGALTAATGTFTSGLTTTGAVTHNGVGTLTLTGANTFTGSWASAGISLMVNFNGTAYLVQLGH